MELDLYVVLLHPEPKVDPDEASDPYFNQVVQRTLDIQGAAKFPATRSWWIPSTCSASALRTWASRC